MTFRDRVNLWAETCASAFAHPVAIAATPPLCLGWWLAGWSIDLLTLLLSIVAITTTQLVLLAQKVEGCRNVAQTREILHALPGARAEMEHLEGKTPEEIAHLEEGRGATEGDTDTPQGGK